MPRAKMRTRRDMCLAALQRASNPDGPRATIRRRLPPLLASDLSVAPLAKAQRPSVGAGAVAPREGKPRDAASMDSPNPTAAKKGKAAKTNALTCKLCRLDTREWPFCGRTGEAHLAQ